MMNTEWVVTSQLRAGDILVHHGVRLRLTETYYQREGDDCIGWRAEYLGCAKPTDTPESLHGPFFGNEFRKGWAIQGNDLAKWSREIPGATWCAGYRLDTQDVSTETFAVWGRAFCHLLARVQDDWREAIDVGDEATAQQLLEIERTMQTGRVGANRPFEASAGAFTYFLTGAN